MDVDSGKNGNAGFPKKKTGRPSGVLREVPPKRLFASFLQEEKGRGRAFDLLFSKIAIFLRGHTDKPFFQVWPEGHLLSSHEERRQRRAKGEPLGTPDALIFRAIVGHHNAGGRPQSLPVQRALQGPVRSSL